MVQWSLCPFLVCGCSRAPSICSLGTTFVGISVRRPKAKPTNVILLALVAYFTQTASRFIHTAENTRYSIVQTAAAIQEMKTELDFVFAVEEPNGAPRKPFCFNDSHKHGYLNIFREAMKLSERRTIVAAGKVMFFQEAAGSVSIAEWVARELGSSLNVKKMFFFAIDAEYHMSVALAFAPF